MRTLRVEWLKVRTTRMWWVLLLSMTAYVLVLAAFITLSFAAAPAGTPGAPDVSDPDVLTSLYAIALPLGYVFPVVLGVLGVTTEYRYRTITPTFLAEPRRARVLLAKLAVSLLLGLAFGVVAVAATVPAVAGVLAATGEATGVTDPAVLAALPRTALAMALWAVVGAALGMVVRNQVAAVVVVIAFSQLVEPLLRLGLAAWSPTQEVSRYLPGAAADALAGGSIYTASGAASLLGPLAGGLVLSAYAAALAMVGVVTTRTRDVA